MPIHRRHVERACRRMDENEDGGGDVSVVDVYDIASDIGKECEKIIDQFGADTVTSLMPKVINALEMLECLATRNERENMQLYELHAKIAQLENDKLEKAEYRDKFEQELESIEEQWRNETKELVAVVTRLEEEKRKFAKTQQQQLPSASDESGGHTTDVIHDCAMLERMRTTLNKQRDEGRTKDKLLQDKCQDVETLKSQVDKLTASIRDLRRKHKSLQTQVRHMCDERADFLVQLHDQQRDIVALRTRLGLAQKENEDLAKCEVANSVHVDDDDANRPRFTTNELKDILNERNELKSRVNDLKEELQTYRPTRRVETEPACEEEDAPVQGPLPFEPDDAPWKKRPESGIKKFFRKLFSDDRFADGDGRVNNFPRRSFTTLSKLALSSKSNSDNDSV